MMMSRVGLELTNFIDPDLTWNRLSKGYRTGTRRSRKQTRKNWEVGAELADSSGKMVEDAETTVSESEKLGVAVLGRRFSDKIVPVPIKKRSFMFRSPSPPPRSYDTSIEQSGQLLDSQHSRNQVRSKSTAKKQLKTRTASTIKFALTTDFSGIAILADAACSNSIGDDSVIAEGSLAEESKPEVIDSSTSGGPPQEIVASSDMTNCSQKDVIHEQGKIGDNLVPCLQNHPCDMDGEKVKKPASLRDDRLHWDLNVSMEAWEQPPELDSEANSVEGCLQISEWCESQKEDTNHKIVSTANCAVGGLVSSDVTEDRKVKSSIPGVCKSDKEMSDVEFFSSIDKNYDNSTPASADQAQESSTEVAEEVKATVPVFCKDTCTNRPLCSLPEGSTSLQMVEDSKTNIIIERKPEVDDKQKDGYDACSNLNNDAMDHDVSSARELVLEKVAHESDRSILNEVSQDPGKMLGSSYAMISQERMSTGSCPPSPVPIEPSSKPEELCVGISAKSEGMSASGRPARESLHGATVDSNGHKDKLVLNADKVGSPHHIESSSVGAPRSDACSKNGSSSASSTDKVSVDEHPVGSFDSDVCQDATERIGTKNNAPDGYESQFEDGELRETDLRWDNDDGEAEFVDYGSDNGEAFDIDAADYSVTLSGKIEVGLECDKGVCVSEAEIEKKMKADSCRLNAVSDHAIGNGPCLEDTMRESGWSEISTNPTSGITEGGSIKKHSADCVDQLDMKDASTRAIGSKPSRREWQSSTGSCLSTDILDRKNGIPFRRGRSDYFDDSYPRAEGMTGSDKPMGRERPALHLRSRSPNGGHSFNTPGSFRDSKRGHSPTNYGSYNSGRSRQRSVVEGRGYAMASDNGISDAVTGVENRIRRPFINSSSNGVFRPHVRRRSPPEREDAYVMPAGMGSVRDISPDRRRFRRYPQGINRGFREDYNGPQPDETMEYSNRLPHRMTRRQRSISPPRGRVPPHYPQPFKKSRSRSRSRSPIGWLVPRNRNEGPRHRSSRSPEFRSKGRMERTRIPFQRQGFEQGYEAGFVSPPPGNRFSPPRNSRWLDDRNGGVDHLRGRRSSPVRLFRPNQRFDSGRPMRRMNASDDGFRPPMIHPAGRYADMPGAGRGRKYEGGEDDRRRNGERYEVTHRVRHYDSDGPLRRYRYDTEDCFAAKSSNNNYDDCNRSNERRPRDVLPRRGSEEKDLPRLNQEQQPRFNQDQQPRFNQDQQPRFNPEQQPRLNQEPQPRLNQEQPPRLNQDQQARFNQDQQSRLNQEQQPRLNQEQPPRLNQEQPPRLNQDQQARLSQENKVNNTSLKSTGVLQEEAA